MLVHQEETGQKAEGACAAVLLAVGRILITKGGRLQLTDDVLLVGGPPVGTQGCPNLR